VAIAARLCRIPSRNRAFFSGVACGSDGQCELGAHGAQQIEKGVEVLGIRMHDRVLRAMPGLSG
jgi:hypothetical protein